MNAVQVGNFFGRVFATAPLPLTGAANIVLPTQVPKDRRTTFPCRSGFRAEPAGEVESVRKILCTGWSCCANRMRMALFFFYTRRTLFFFWQRKRRGGCKKAFPPLGKRCVPARAAGEKAPCLQGRKTPAHGVGEKSFMSFTKETKSPRLGPGTFLHHSF